MIPEICVISYFFNINCDQIFKAKTKNLSYGVLDYLSLAHFCTVQGDNVSIKICKAARWLESHITSKVHLLFLKPKEIIYCHKLGHTLGYIKQNQVINMYYMYIYELCISAFRL